MNDLDDVQKQVEDLEPRVERLKALYQQFFMGIEKIPPLVLRKEVDRTIWQLRRKHFRNTRVRFKFQQIVQRYNTYQQYWSRVMRQIENGTYQRDVLRAARRFGESEVLTIAGRRAQRALHRLDERDSEPPVTWELEEEDWDDEAITPPSGQWVPPELQAGVVAEASAPATPQVAATATEAAQGPEAGPAAAAPPEKKGRPALPGGRASRPGALPGVGARGGALFGARPPAGDAPAPRPAEGEQRTRALYDEYLKARRAAGESTTGISYDKLARTLENQTQALRRQHGANTRVDYVVITKDGKPMIRPVIK